jgi:intracellular multiplication protein IcmK
LQSGPAGGGGPAVASAGFYVCTPTVGSNVLQVAPASLQPRGGLLVTLKGAPKPISFMLVAGGGNYDADLSVQVAERGPNAKGPATGPAAPDTASPFLTAMLDGAPPLMRSRWRSVASLQMICAPGRWAIAWCCARASL